jgi:hypothetical protein
MYTVLSSRESARNAEAEQQYEFTIYVLQHLGIPEEELSGCFPEEGFLGFTVDHKIKLRSVLQKFNTIILDDRDGGVKIFVESQLVAEWKKCLFKYKVDPKAINIADRIYVEIICDYNVCFEE